MDGQRFDDLTRALTTGASRRGVVKGLLGGAAGGALAMLGMRRGLAAPTPRPAGATCIRNAHCASGLCDQATRRCVCPAGQVNCAGACVDPVAFQTDPTNCGACGNRCGAGQERVGGGCRDRCEGGTTFCNGACVPNCPAGQALNTACRCVCASGEACGDVCCVLPETCGGGGVTGACGCTAEAASATCGSRVCGTATNTCGAEVICGACAGGQACSTAGQCVCATTSCAGCCDGATCQPGTTPAACGSGGGECATCTGSQNCVNGACQDCTRLEGRCTAASECCDDGTGTTVCRQDFTVFPTCCRLTGGTCGDDFDCCNERNCENGVCADPACHFAGGSCTSAFDCCRNHLCNNSICIEQGACLNPPASCTANVQCCTGFCDPASGTCSCLPDGVPCSDNSHCCAGSCSAQTCFSCRDLTESCTANDQCCSQFCDQGSGLCLCKSFGATCITNVTNECCTGYCNPQSRTCDIPPGPF